VKLVLTEEQMMRTRGRFDATRPANPGLAMLRLPAVLLPALVVVVAIGGCAAMEKGQGESAPMTRADTPAMPTAEERQEDARTPLPPPRIGAATIEAADQGIPRFPRRPDWNSTFWDISSP